MTTVRQTITLLDRIVSQKARRLAARSDRQSVAELQRRLLLAGQSGELPPPGDFAGALLQGKSISVIAEIKKASPSRGLIQPDFHPAEQALAYAAAGVQAISVLTEEDFFGGSDQDLLAVCPAVSLPVLRKDFVLEPCQIYEARLLGASAVLLICTLLNDRELGEYLTLSRSLGMEALVEIHNLTELMRALAADARIIGINNRDLRTFQVDIHTTERLAGLVPAGRIVVAESGINTAGDLARVYRAGARAALIGETLMRAAGSPLAVQDRLQDLFRELPR